MPGQAKASTPKSMAASPRRASAHQFLARTGSTPRPTGELALLVVISTTPFLAYLQLSLLVALAQEEQVQERQERGQRRGDVREGGRGQYPPGTFRLLPGEQAVAGQEVVGAGGSVDLHRKRHQVESQNRPEQDGRQLDEEGRPYEHADEEEGQPDLAAKGNQGEEPRPELHGQV